MVNRGTRLGCCGIGFFLLFGLIFLTIGIWMSYASSRAVSGAVKTPGTVTALAESDNSEDSGHSYAPEVHYVVNGEQYKIAGHVHSSPPAYHIGETVTVLYHADDPSKGRIDSFVELWLLPVVFTAIGGIISIVFAVAVLWKILRPI